MIKSVYNYPVYNNGLYLNQALATESSWTVEKLKARTEQLVQEVLGKYPLVVTAT